MTAVPQSNTVVSLLLSVILEAVLARGVFRSRQRHSHLRLLQALLLAQLPTVWLNEPTLWSSSSVAALTCGTLNISFLLCLRHGAKLPESRQRLAKAAHARLCCHVRAGLAYWGSCWLPPRTSHAAQILEDQPHSGG